MPQPMSSPRANGLLLCAPAPVSRSAGGWLLDIKFIEGMQLHAAQWDGPLTCVLWENDLPNPYGRDIQAETLDFRLIVLPKGAPLPDIDGIGMGFLAADMVQFPTLAAELHRKGIPFVASLEYTLQTRMEILRLDRGLSPLRRLRRMIWQLGYERRLRRGLQLAAGVQFNGWPAMAAYQHLTPSPYLYLDNRMSADLMATPAEEAARCARLLQGAPLRLIHSGRLEPMKGAQDLLPVMRALQRENIPATLDIYGSGSLVPELRAGLAEFGGQVRLHDPVDFRSELVPVNRQSADIFLSCHRQSDPSCSYIEAMGCGLSVAGYDNHMWQALQADSASGVLAPMGQPEALAAQLAAWHRDRHALVASGTAAAAYARQHDFEREFTGRMQHLAACVR